MLRLSGVSELDVDAARPPEDQAVEVFCNRVAAAALMPRRLFMAESAIRDHRSGPEAWTDEEIGGLSRRYGVSRESIVRRLFTFRLTTRRFYEAKRRKYADEFKQVREQQREHLRASKATFATNPPREALLNLGEPFVRRVLESYYQERMTLSDVSSYLGIRTRHVSKLEKMSEGRGG
jgi:Zn-dependent peptidase ImmA (M78 family)